MECAIIGSDRETCGIRLHLVITNLFLDKMSQLVDFVDEAPGLVGSIYSIGCRVGHRLVTKKIILLWIILLLDLWGYLMNGLLSVVSLTVMNPPVPS